MSLEWILLGLRLLTTVILYTFLGLAFYLIWADLKRAEHQKSAAASRLTHQLRVVSTAGNPSLPMGETLPLQPVTFLGRAPDNTIVLRDASVAARHARLVQENGAWWLEDLSSQGDILLNDSVLSESAVLTNGDTINIGNFSFRLEAISSRPD